MVPKYAHVLLLGTCEYVSLRGQRDFADMVKRKALKWGDYFGLNLITGIRKSKAPFWAES